MKKLLSVVLSISMLMTSFCVFSLPVMAAEYTSGVYTYTVDSNDEATITACSGAGGVLTIPDTLGGYPVVGIGRTVFKDFTALTGVVLPDTLVTLGYQAFANTAITSIEIPKSLDTAEAWGYRDYTFNDTNYRILDGPFYCCEKLKTVTFQKGTTQIAKYLFAGCTGLESITIPDTVTDIEYTAFKGCLRLKSVFGGEAVTNIEETAFGDCYGLETIPFFRSLVTLGYQAFANTAITSIEIPKSLDTAETWGYKDYTFNDTNYRILDGPFYCCEKLKTVTFQKGTTQIAKCLFAGCTGLESITIPDTVTDIEYNAFQGCLQLKSIVVPDTVVNIEESVFSDCASLESAKLPNTCEDVVKSTFRNCVSLESIELPTTVKTIKQYAFDGCSALKNITFQNDESWLYEIGTNAFSNCTSLETIELPTPVKYIQGYAFDGCTALKDITFQNDESLLYEIKNQAFRNCSSLTGGFLGNPNTCLRTIGSRAFEGCTGMENLVLTDSIAEIGSYAFTGCTGLKSVKFPAYIKTFSTYVFSGCELLTDVDIPNYCFGELPEGTFMDCTELQSIVLPKGLGKIKANAFKNCASLTDVTIYSSVYSIDDTAFSYPFKTTIYGMAGSYAETFANDNDFKAFVAIDAPCESIAFAGGAAPVLLDVGESILASFNTEPDLTTDEIVLSTDSGLLSFNSMEVTALKSGDSTVTATADSGVSCTFTVHARDVASLEISQMPAKTHYDVGEELDLSGMTVLVKYDDDTSKPVTDYTVSGFDSEDNGTCNVTVTWVAANGRNYRTSFTVNIGEQPTEPSQTEPTATEPTATEPSTTEPTATEPTSSGANGELTWRVGNAEAAVGGKVTVPVEITQNGGVYAFRTAIRYNPETLRYLKATVSEDAANSGLSVVSNEKDGVITLIGSTNDGTVNTYVGNVVTLTFAVVTVSNTVTVEVGDNTAAGDEGVVSGQAEAGEITINVPGEDEPSGSTLAVTIGDKKGKPGDVVEIPVYITENPGVNMMQFTVDFDDSLMTFVEVEWDDAFSNEATLTAGTEEDGLLYLQMICNDGSKNCTTVGQFATLRFKLDNKARAGKYFLNGSFNKKQILDKDAEYVPMTIADGSLRVRTVTFPSSAEVVTEAKPGETVFVPVTVECDTDVMSLQVDVDFDASSLLFVDAMTPELEGCDISISDDGKTLLLASGDFEKPISGTITTILEFQVAEDAPLDEYEVSASYEEDAILSTIGGTINPALLGVSGGLVKVTDAGGAMLGDANSDEAVNMKDVLLMRKFLANLTDELDMTAADVNMDGDVNMKDVLMLRKFLANLIDKLGV